MKTETNIDNNLLVTAVDNRFDKGALEGQYGAGFIGRVYRTTLVAWATVALLLFNHYGLAAVLGLSIGTAVSLGSLYSVELTVRLLTRPGVHAGGRYFTLLLFLKLPLLTAVMAAAVWAVLSGVANVFTLVAGVALVHGVILLKAVGGVVVAGVAPEAKVGTRRPLVQRLTAARLAHTGRGQSARRPATLATVWHDRSREPQPASD
jgi:hypothetical protein